MPTPQRKSPPRKKKNKAAAPSSLRRLCFSALLVAVIVGLSVFLNTLISSPSPDALAMAGYDTPTPTPVPTPTPEPTITPTPALYAPFGAQYGFGGDELLPETPTPEPSAVSQVQSPSTPTPQPTAQAASRTLKRGLNGSDVTRMQQALIDLGYLSGTADGDFGQNTQDAVIQFQAVNGLTADGLAGAQTLSLLYSGSARSADQAPPMDYLILVNRDHAMGENDVPMELVSIESTLSSSIVKVKYSGTKANRTAVLALGEMFSDAIAQGISNWQISSAYRTYAAQQQLVDNSVSSYQKNNPSWSKSRCLSATYQTVAPAGTSEHQTGLAFDITVPGVSFTGTKQQIWLHKNCTKYGFIVRFTEEKQSITGFLAESWHIRYVGVEAAAVMQTNSWCLEEYIEHMGL